MRHRKSGIRLYQRGRIWWTQYYDPNGKRHDVSTKCRDRDAAIEVAARFEREGANPLAATQNAATVADACELYRQNKQRLIKRDKRSSESLEFFETKIGNVQRVLESSGPLRLVDLMPSHLDRYVEQRESEPGARRESSVSAHTIKKELIAFRQALELAVREGHYAGDVARLFPSDHTAEYEPRDRALDRDEVSRLIAALAPKAGQHRPLLDGDRAARVAFLVATAARWSGSERCMRADVAPDLSWVRLRETKTKLAERVVPIVTPDQKALLKFALANAGGQNGRLFRPWDSKSRDLVNACARAGIERCSPNDLRRTMATWLRAGGASPDVISMILGHTTARMVEAVYARLQRQPEAIRRLLQAQLQLDPNCSAIAAEWADSAALGARGALPGIAQVLEIQESAVKSAI